MGRDTRTPPPPHAAGESPRARIAREEGERLRGNYADVQGIVLSAYGHLPHAAYLFLRFPRGGEGGRTTPAAAQALAEQAREVAPVRVEPVRQKRSPSAVNLAFTFPGLAALGLSGDTLATFPPEFRGGIAVPFRSKALGDVGLSAPPGWEWGGSERETPDLLLLCFGRTREVLDGLVGRCRDRWVVAAGATEVATEWATPDMAHEHFGFRDNISGVPIAGGLTGAEPGSDGRGVVLPGEFMLGYRNEYEAAQQAAGAAPEGYDDQYALSPCLRGEDLARGAARGSDAGDIGTNGTYLVFRKLEQDVPGFWDYCRRQAAAMLPDAGAVTDTAERLAAKMVGRWRDGEPLALCPFGPDPRIAADPGGIDDFCYRTPGDADPYGDRCPIGAHIRRANPRDSLPGVEDRNASLDIVAHHRILRRGRPYGAPYKDAARAGDAPGGGEPEPWDPHYKGKRGLLFICAGASIARQFEFVQQTWIADPKFGGLWSEPDPLLGSADDVTRAAGKGGAKGGGGRGATPDPQFTIPQGAAAARVRLRRVPRFVTVRAGAYLFLPGVTALGRIAAVAGGEGAAHR